MKNLKKVLALVLVVAMMASFAVSASAASFTDNDKIVYNDAVKLLSTLEVVNGFTDGSFNPEGNVTRAQTAKMIAYIMNGGADASSSFASSAKFNDVANGYWAANSIGYCATKEIVAGAGNNLYYPNNDVTGVQLAKMALVALGYDPTIEGLTGSAWAINTIDLAEDAGLFDDMNKDFNASAAASRQEAAQILYNMLLSEMVCYTDNGTNIIIGDITINTDATRKYMKADGEGTDKKSEAELAVEEYFDLTGTGKVTGGTDDYGRPARVIDVKGVDSITLPDDADLTYDGQVTAGTLYSNLGNDVRDYAQSVWIDGDEVYAEKYGDNGKIEVESGDDKYKVNIKKNDDTKNSAKGATMEVYIDKDAEAVTFVIINTYLAQVDSIDENKDDENLLDIDFNVFDLGTITLDEQESFGYEEDDYVLVNLGNNGSKTVISVIGAPETVEGTADTQASDYYKIDGTKYNLSASLNENPAEGDYSGTYTFYLDQMGNIVGSTEIEAGTSADKYLYLSKSEAGNDIDGTWVKVKVTFTDGTESTVNLEIKNTKPDVGDTSKKVDCYKNADGDWVAVPADGATNLFIKDFYSFTKNSDGEYTLKNIDSDYAVELSDSDIDEILDGDSDMSNGLRANTSTKLYLVESDTVYTGYKNFPDEVKGAENILALKSSKGSSTASAIYVFNEDGVKDTVTVAMYTGTSEKRDGDTYAEFFIDGAREFKLISSGDELVKHDLYELDGEEAIALKDGETEYEDGVYQVVTGKVTKVETDSYFTLEGKGDFEYGFDDDALAIYDATDDGQETKLSKNDVVTVAYYADGANYALVVFITD